MAPRYDEQAIEKCFRLYLRFNGQQHQRIEQEMRKVYPGWQRSYLYTRGTGKNLKIGWIEKFGWEKALELHLVSKPTASLNNAQKLVREVEEVREKLFTKIKTEGAAQVGKDVLYLHRDYSKLSIEALTKVEAARDTLGGFVSFYERFIDWLTDIDQKLATGILKIEDLIIDRAEQEFGETEETLKWQREVDTRTDAANSANAAAEPGAQA